MAKTLSDKSLEQKHVAEIVKHGEKIIIPSGMSVQNAIEVLMRREQYEQQTVKMTETFDVFPWDGAVALNNVLKEMYGWSPAVPTPGFWADHPPELRQVEIDHGKYERVPWGRFLLPNVDGYLNTSAGKKNGRLQFSIYAEVKRMYEDVIQSLFDSLRKECALNSIYRGKAIKMRFRDEDGEAMSMPEPKFMDPSGFDINSAIYPEVVQKAIHTNLYTPIMRAIDCARNGIPVKRGVMLGGTYGTGKTLAARVASGLAARAGVTFLYVPRADELAEAIEFAKQYQSPACVVFCEDIDRVVSGKRSVKMDDILNIIDGIDSKTNNIIVVLTTNDLSSINPAMLRPGRLDAVIEVTPPDAVAVEKLIRLYAGRTVSRDTDLSRVGKVLAGNIPAIIAEVVKRAKLSQLAIQEPGTYVERLTEDALLEAAQTMQAQVELIRKMTNSEESPDRLEEAMVATFRTALNGTEDKIAKAAKGVKQIKDAVGIS